MKRITLFLLLIICLPQIKCNSIDDLRILREITGPYQTNCYLIYDIKSKEAALIDPGWKIDTLVMFIKNNALDLKYIFITHAHTDHYYYLPELKKQFPKSKWCLNKEDFEKITKCPDWQVKAHGQEWIDKARKNPEAAAYLDFDTRSVGEPDIFIRGNQTYRLGSIEVKTIYTPGHSPGGICYYTGNILFSGDVLFYRSVGKLFMQGSDKEALVKSVRNLYRLFSDSTVVYPGHNQNTDIGSEKKENRQISENGGDYDVRYK
jgi:glyoxylase-like metal-dependent hydrolase (beta-lactamase superfamily II)